MVVLCVVLLSLQAVEMSQNARARRQSNNDNLVTLEVPQNILARLVKALLEALGLKVCNLRFPSLISVDHVAKLAHCPHLSPGIINAKRPHSSLMKSYLCILIALCVVLVTVQAAEISSRTRRQSDHLTAVNIPRDLLDSLLKALLGEGGVRGLLETILGNRGGN
ncbi:uncharacterized protein TNIN_161851 [Trichonephila inaurata madagascariensis]|uniref:Uncharacterized protein n=1 Tax=Trichonephila inaurata madagascariensis TaxID=2747483 RepID=A0A8X6YVV0_9ARAC|nr:uncharacterized protein TNIN_161851 [Trichonephila inaurata madagascariensis]